MLVALTCGLTAGCRQRHCAQSVQAAPLRKSMQAAPLRTVNAGSATAHSRYRQRHCAQSMQAAPLRTVGTGSATAHSQCRQRHCAQAVQLTSTQSAPPHTELCERAPTSAPRRKTPSFQSLSFLHAPLPRLIRKCKIPRLFFVPKWILQ